MSSQFHIGIDVVVSHFRNDALLKDFNQYRFNQHPIRRLVIELTERDALLDVGCRIVRELNRLGAELVTDDSDTDSSSLSWLEEPRSDVLKIDKSFISAIGTGAINSAVTDIITAPGKKLNMELMAEGIETRTQARHLRQHGVHLLQGFLYTKSIPLRDFPKWLAGSMPLPAPHNRRYSMSAMPFH